MLFNYLFFFYLLYSSFADMTSVPVFLLDNDNVLPGAMDPVNPFAKLPQPDFMELVQQVRKRSSSVIIFVENEFCTEDISTKDKLGSPFYNLHRGFTEQKVRYFPSILQPYELLNHIFRPHDNNVFYLKDKTTKLHIYDNRFKYFYVFFEDKVNETRINSLRRHDSIINKVFHFVKKFHVGPVSALYTGRTNPLMPKLRHVPFSTRSDQHTARFVTDYAMITLSDVTLLKAGTRWPLTDKIRKSDEWMHQNNMPVVGFDITNFRLNFVFVVEEKGWLLWRIRWRERNVSVGTKVTNLRAPWNVSFACSVPIHIINERDGSVITISNYQLELVKEWLEEKPVKRSAKIRRKFLRSVNCQPFFSAPIVTFLFLTFICLGILFFGVLMLMDCNANDRYDDPQGKPLTITQTLN